MVNVWLGAFSAHISISFSSRYLDPRRSYLDIMLQEAVNIFLS